jgi:hypothetical protein
MFRLLLILTLVVYLLYKLGLFRVFVGSVKQGYRDPESVNRKPSGDNVHIDSAPAKDKPKSDYKGGEYVDYEEVK